MNSGFNVTALTRQDSTSTFPDGVHVHKTDYDSESSLAEAFKGQDAVVSVIATAALGSQSKIIEAAAQAGVKRFIPSEFGVNVLKLEDGGMKKILGAKVKARELLEKIAAGNKDFTWTGISTNLFFDWVCYSGSRFGVINNDLGTHPWLTWAERREQSCHHLRLRQRIFHNDELGYNWSCCFIGAQTSG